MLNQTIAFAEAHGAEILLTVGVWGLLAYRIFA